MKLCISFLLLSAAFAVSAQPLPDYTFKSPAFNGNGYSAHILTIENQEHNRREAIQKEIQAKLEKEANDAKNTNIAKFMNNLERRIYAQISQNLATAMFATGGSNSGSLNFEGNTIFYSKDAGNVYLTVTDNVGNQTRVTIPLGQFQF